MTQYQVYRGWINQPSMYDSLHSMHGTRCIVIDKGERTVDIYFTEGSVLSMHVLKSQVSKLQLSKAG